MSLPESEDGCYLTAHELAALLIFLLTYGLISFGRLGKSRIEMPSAALLGGALMLIFGLLSPAEALSDINWNTIVLLLGMMLTVSSMEACGFFHWISGLIVKGAHRQFSFVVYTSLLTAFLSALILNDAVVLIFTPVIIIAARRINVSPVPALIMEAISANIGSAATEVGNPQNAYIASVSGVAFRTFSFYLLPVTVLSLLVALIISYFFAEKRDAGADTGVKEERVNRLPLIYIIASVTAIFAGFFTSSETHIPIATVALIGGVINFFVTPLITGRNSQELLVRIDWGIILFFIGLFILIGGIESSGLLSGIVYAITFAHPDALESIAGLNVATAILSNLVSNVPAVLLLSPVIKGGATTKLWVTLAGSSTLAGNATIIGAAANVIVARSASREGVSITLRQFMKYGLPITLISLLFNYLLIVLLP
jgi:Na+/H+ antiporter NhaD/arsenite permease-like protein